jgi:hypothetical protein
VVGHHPHVVQDAECVDGRPVFFSLGNHVFDQKYPATKSGLIADCGLSSRALRCLGIRTRTSAGTSVPRIDSASAFASLRRCAVPIHRTATLGALVLRAAPWTPGDTGSTLAIEAWEDGERRWATKRANVRSLETGIVSDTGEPLLLSLEMHASDIDRQTALRPYVYAAGPRGLEARWRGSALAWPLIDATVERDGTICALHRGDSFVQLDSTSARTRSMRYRWNGFGFSAARNPVCAIPRQADRDGPG